MISDDATNAIGREAEVVQDDPQTAAVKADTEARLAKQTLNNISGWLMQRFSFRTLYSELFFLLLFFALALRFGAGLGASVLITTMLFITPWLRHAARAPATILMLLLLVDWAGLLPVTKWTIALINISNQAAGG